MIPNRAVQLAARLLPRNLRERYREQWTSDLRDAAEAGVPPREIATGALAFALTVARPLPWSRAGLPDEAAVQRRSRFAAALAISGALVSLSTYAATAIFEFGVSTADAFFGAFAIVAPLVATVFVTRTRAVDTRVRLTVWLLLLAAVVPAARRFIAPAGQYQQPLWSLADLAYVAAALIVVLALVLLRLGLRHASSKAHAGSVLAVVLAALAVVGVGVLGAIHAASLWASRAIPEFSWASGYGVTLGKDGHMVRTEIVPTRADYEEWLAATKSYEHHVTSAFVVCAALAIALALVVIVLPRVLNLGPVSLAVAAIAVLMIANSALLSLIRYSFEALAIPPDVPLVLGQCVLVAWVLYAVGGVQLGRLRLPRVGHRHDVEGAVELL